MLRILTLLVFMLSGAHACLEEREQSKITVSLIKPSDITSEEIVELTKLVNTAYLKGEEGICLPTMGRTSISEITQMIQQDELVGLRIGNAWKGCIHVSLSPHDETKQSGIFGMLAVADDPQYRNKGYGTLLVDFAETWAKEKGYTHMMLELIQPADWVQAHKKRLEDWYVKRGYKHVDTKSFPHPEVLIPQNYTFKIFKKDF